MTVRQPPVIQELQQHIEHLRVGLLDLIEQHHAVWAAAHRLGQLPALFIAHVAGRRAHQARDSVFFLVLAHVNAHHGVLVIEQELRQGARQLGFPDAGGTQEDERADRPVGILQTGARPAHSVGHCPQGVLLPDHALVQALFHVDELLQLAFQQPRDRDPGPA